MSYRPYDPASEYGRLLAIAERLHDAIASRDVALVEAILEARSATSLPRGLREEALAIVRLPASSHRAPMALLQFHHRLTELARSDDSNGDEFRRFEEELAASGDAAEDDDSLWDEEAIERADAPPAPDPAQIDLPLDRRRYGLGETPRWGGASRKDPSR